MGGIMKYKMGYKPIIALIFAAIIMICVVWGKIVGNSQADASTKPIDYMYLGGELFSEKTAAPTFFAQTKNEEIETYRRPSMYSALINPYSGEDTVSLSNRSYADPISLVNAYFAILGNASSLEGYSGAGGSVGRGKTPYADAYRLFSSRLMKRASLETYEDSFSGTANIILLQVKQFSGNAPFDLSKAEEYAPFMPIFRASAKISDKKVAYIFVETEMMSGFPMRENTKKEEENAALLLERSGGLSCFVYHYYVIKAVCEETTGWKLDEISVSPESFLIAPEHGWNYVGESFSSIVLRDNLALIDKVSEAEPISEKTARGKSMMAQTKGVSIKLEFVTLANGWDLFITAD
jgi:hypothetical protein